MCYSYICSPAGSRSWTSATRRTSSLGRLGRRSGRKLSTNTSTLAPATRRYDTLGDFTSTVCCCICLSLNTLCLFRVTWPYLKDDGKPIVYLDFWIQTEQLFLWVRSFVVFSNSNKYVLLQVKSIRLVGVLLIVYVREEHVQHLSLIDTDSVPTGIMGMLVCQYLEPFVTHTIRLIEDFILECP